MATTMGMGLSSRVRQVIGASLWMAPTCGQRGGVWVSGSRNRIRLNVFTEQRDAHQTSLAAMSHSVVHTTTLAIPRRGPTIPERPVPDRGRAVPFKVLAQRRQRELPVDVSAIRHAMPRFDRRPHCRQLRPSPPTKRPWWVSLPRVPGRRAGTVFSARQPTAWATLRSLQCLAIGRDVKTLTLFIRRTAWPAVATLANNPTPAAYFVIIYLIRRASRPRSGSWATGTEMASRHPRPS